MLASIPKRLPFILFALALLSMAGCETQIANVGVMNGTGIGLAAAYLGITATKPKPLPPADTASQIAAHESWCYSTLAQPQCYTQPQMGEGSRLINVDPQNRYPLTPRAYEEAAVQAKIFAAPRRAAH